MPQDLTKLQVRIHNIHDHMGPRCYATIDNGLMPLAAGYATTPQAALLAAAKQWAGERPATPDPRLGRNAPETSGSTPVCLCGDPDFPGIEDNDPPDWENPGLCRNCGGYCEQK